MAVPVWQIGVADGSRMEQQLMECGRVVYKGAGYLCCNRWLFDGSDAEDIGCYPEGYRITDKQYVGWKDSCIAILTRYRYTVKF